MSRMDRRGSIRLAIASALAATLSTKVSASQIDSGSRIAPPTRPMRFCRIVERDLVDGQSFRVSRGFTVEFSRIAEGYLISGRQSDVSVNAPDSLSSFAELEQQRDESGLFPLELNPLGQIQSVNSDRLGEEQIEAAVEQALSAIARLPMPEDEREQARLFVAALHNTGQGITAHMPHDLFAPASLPRRTQQVIALPDGAAGRVETLFDGQLDPQTGLMSAAVREIVTAVDGSERTTREEWSLTPV